MPVYFIRYRYPHHAFGSGYDRLCDYVGETIKLSRSLYWLGETVLRVPAKLTAKYGGQFEYSRYDFVMELEAIRHFLRHRRSVYHFVYAEKSYRMMRHFAGRNGNKLVGTIHHPPEHNEWLFRSMDHFKCLDLVTLVSKIQVPYWESILGRERVAYVPHAVDTAHFSPPSRIALEHPPRCVFIGEHERDLKTLSNLVSLVLSANPHAEFRLFSRNPQCGRITAVHERATWHKSVSDGEYLSWLRSSDLLVLPLLRSTANTAVLEAMACGLPVVTNEGGVCDYVNDRCAVIRPVGDAEGMATAVLELLSNERLRHDMAIAARARAEEFAWPRIAATFVRLYRDLF